MSQRANSGGGSTTGHSHEDPAAEVGMLEGEPLRVGDQVFFVGYNWKWPVYDACGYPDGHTVHEHGAHGTVIGPSACPSACCTAKVLVDFPMVQQDGSDEHSMNVNLWDLNRELPPPLRDWRDALLPWKSGHERNGDVVWYGEEGVVCGPE